MTAMPSAAPAFRRSLAAASAAAAVVYAASASVPEEAPQNSICEGCDDVADNDRSSAAARRQKLRRPLRDTIGGAAATATRHLAAVPAPCRCDAAAVLRAGPPSSAGPSVSISVRDSRSGPSSGDSASPGTGGGGAKKAAGLATSPSASRHNIQRRRTISLLTSSATLSSLEKRYEVHPTPLGEGAYGEVYLATDRRTGEQLALKKISKERTNKVEFGREMDALMYLRRHGGHPNICMLRENFDEPGHYVLILDLIRGGELFDHLIENGAYSEADAARLVREVASALDFCHAIGIVHADLKPENLMLSSRKGSAAAIKIVDFGCSEILPQYDEEELADLGDDDLVAQLKKGLSEQARRMSPGRIGGSTPAYCPPESFDGDGVAINPSVDMWSLGIIIYIMLTGVHPFDLEGDATDEEVEANIMEQRSPPLFGSPITAHLSPSALNLLAKLFDLDPDRRITAHKMLQHPWVLGRTASHDVIGGSAKRLSRFGKFQEMIEQRSFEEFVNWSDNAGRRDPGEKSTSLLERAFVKLDRTGDGVLTAKDLEGYDQDELGGGTSSGAGTTASASAVSAEVGNEAGQSDELCLSGFSDLLGENMKQKFFPRGHVVYHEGDHGDRMYFINSGSVHVSTKDGFTAKLGHGDTFGEGGLMEKHKRRSATIKCATPVHAIEIDEECFRRYLARSDSDLAYRIREKVNARRFGRAEQLISKQEGLRGVHLEQGGFVFEHGEEPDAMYILENGLVDVVAMNGSKVCSMRPGDLFGFQSFMINRSRKASATCVSNGGCQLKRMEKDDFHTLMREHPNLRGTLRELGLRREFQRAVVIKTRRSFPTESELREVFGEIDADGAGALNASEIKELCTGLDKMLSDDEIAELIRSLDLNGSGTVSFDEFKSVFGLQPKYHQVNQGGSE
uniref:cGMP-dependent protein kinase n=1 Tax=Odontella aurita TaxID=265563 RepID=A0A7S4MYY0_9STRA|mmetsp:Transcript_40828/g.123008  ORF Transcript_40828/g.123008 Transcript_40828/m.123008 type:complete len:910 (+) Transcript_40828:38-2767(+)